MPAGGIPIFPQDNLTPSIEYILDRLTGSGVTPLNPGHDHSAQGIILDKTDVRKWTWRCFRLFRVLREGYLVQLIINQIIPASLSGNTFFDKAISTVITILVT